ncbi:MAG: YdbC family protein [Spirochaetaceae bacterium]|nr:YdbC family protein [Spirochaetaceae bacterium]
MADSITFEITKRIGTLAEARGGWMKELNLVSWNGRQPKYDIREWAPDHEKMGKGVTLTEDEAKTLAGLIAEQLGMTLS